MGCWSERRVRLQPSYRRSLQPALPPKRLLPPSIAVPSPLLPHRVAKGAYPFDLDRSVGHYRLNKFLHETSVTNVEPVPKLSVTLSSVPTETTVVLLEPRGHGGLIGAMLTEPVAPGGHAGLLFMDAEGYPALSGGAVMAAATSVQTRWGRITLAVAGLILALLILIFIRAFESFETPALVGRPPDGVARGHARARHVRARVLRCQAP